MCPCTQLTFPRGRVSAGLNCLPTLDLDTNPSRPFSDLSSSQGLRIGRNVLNVIAGVIGNTAKRADQPYAPGDRGIWVKSKCLNREEFVVVGWTDPGSRHR